MGILYQVLGTGVICYISVSMGLMFTWPSSAFKTFSSENTTLDRPMTETELSLFGSLSSIGALIGTPIAAYFLDILGRKYCAIGSALTHVIAWSMITAFNKVEIVLTAVFISGLGGAVFLVVPLYVSEICQESIRGTMTSGSMIFYGLGMLVSYLMGGLMEYYSMVYASLTMAVIGAVSLCLMKESPLFLMKRGFEEEAAKMVAFYRQKKPDDKEVLQEMDALRRALNPDLDGDSPETPEEEKLKPLPKTEEKEKLSLWQFIKKSRSTRRAIFVTLTLVSASAFQGLVVVQVYAEPLFSEAVPNMSPTVNSVLFCLVAIVAGFIAAYLIERAGRRPLIIYSAFACAICCVALGSQLHVHWAPHWVTALLMYIFNIVYTCGAGTVPYVLAAEIFLPEVKTFMSMLVFEWIFLCFFIILFIFNPLVAAMGLGPVFYIFATVCVLTGVFAIIFQPETKGLAVDEIQVKFLERPGKLF